MTTKRSSRRHGALALLIVLAVAACKDKPKSTRWDDAGAAVKAPAEVPASDVGPTPTAPPIETGFFNKFFPKDGDGGYKRVFTADREGYAEAKLQKDGKDVATLSISDSERTPTAKSKFHGATEMVNGFPVVKIGNNQSSVLVKDRFQVKVSSPTLDHDARKAILSTFDLKGLSS